ncbi:hypothetical protein BD779DRAFT_1668532 [Infundibulicybe gibba]|nr:hypothetical protein BD779DRAFT_1668532 [Infundibulicybe gibba]
MRRSSTQSPPTQLRRAAPRQTSPPWTQLVWTLCSDPHAQDPAALAHHAACIASSYPWTPSTLASLAEQLCLAGADPQYQSTHTSAAAVTQADRPVASVTGALYDALHETHGPHTAGSLLWHLAECATEAFREFWDPSLPHSMTPQNAPTCGYAAKAACSAAFIGDLFSCDLISPQHLFGCLTILLQGFISVEHCAAFSAAVQRAGPRILVPDSQQPYEAAEYFRHFLWAAGSLKDGSSVVGVSLRKGGWTRGSANTLGMEVYWYS